ncbi:hypothetical protein AAG570_001323 [Ranatra chinensis]|uniref:Uncharacterized protein n=1 Tax=Ranatra chinensis TaxID=642074 RepID=A0ABD0YDF6_9HEMI
MASYYDILGCDKDASYEVLKQAYYKLILKNHPDKKSEVGGSIDVACNINEAWQTLRDEDKRKLYDAELLQSEIDNQALLYGTYSLTELDYDTDTRTYLYSCRCGGSYELPADEIMFQKTPCLVECNECSLRICILNNL